MKFLTTVETAKKWEVSASLVLKLARGGRIPGAVQIGSRWMIPENAEKPADGRTRAGKAEMVQERDTFRFPGFEYRSLSSFDPPLNEEELVIKATTEAVYACRFEEADRLLGNLADRTADRYLRINALYTGCMIDIYLCNTARFLERYDRLTSEMEEDFPHKTEMMEFIRSIEATLGADDYYTYEFQVRSDYAYHESFLPRLANLCALPLSLAGGKPTGSELGAHELNCIFLENSEAYADLVPLHLYLGIAYGELGNTEKQMHHLRKALIIAEEHEIYFSVAYHYYYMRKLFKPVITEFSEDFRKRLDELSESVYNRYVRFMDTMSMTSIYKLLSHNDYVFLHYAVQGLTHREIADRLHTSVSAVGKQFGEIYALWGVHSKAELAALYRQLVSGTILGKP